MDDRRSRPPGRLFFSRLQTMTATAFAWIRASRRPSARYRNARQATLAARRRCTLAARDDDRVFAGPDRSGSAAHLDVPALDRPDGGVRRRVYAGGRVGIAGVGRDRADLVGWGLFALPVVAHLDTVEFAYLTLVWVADAGDTAAHMRDVPDDSEAVDLDVDHHVEAATVQLKLALRSAVGELARAEGKRPQRPVWPDHVARSGRGRDDPLRGRWRLRDGSRD